MSYKPLTLAIILLGIVWVFYFSNFNNGLSASQGDWGTFGDFTGGVVNPLLNFITIYLLITQYKEASKDLKRQREEDAIKSFEGSFFTFTTIALNEYKTYEIKFDGEIYKSAEAIGFIQEFVEQSSKKGEKVGIKFNELDQQLHDSIFSLISSYCVVFKLIEDSCPAAAKDKYINLFSMLLPTKITFLLCICETATKWKMLDYPRRLSYFDKESVGKALRHYRSLVTPDIN